MKHTLKIVREAKERARIHFMEYLPLVDVGITRIGQGYGLTINLSNHVMFSSPTSFEGIPIRYRVVNQILGRPS